MSYEKVAKFYDLFGQKEDIEFFRTLALESGPRALELGVGTARVAIELARAGVTVTGIDNSRDMLSQARQKLAREPEEVRERVHLIYQDFRQLELDSAFDLIYSPAGGFQAAWTRDEQIEVLNRVRNHLAPGGRLALAIWRPPARADYGLLKVGKPAIAPDGREVIRSWVWRTSSGGEGLEIDLFYEVYRDHELEERYHVSGRMAILSEPELRLLLEKTGFTIDEVQEGFDRSKDTPATEWIVVTAHTG